MNRLPLIIINGWGGTEIIWQPLIQLLRQNKALLFTEIRCVDLPGFGSSADVKSDAPLEWLASVLPETCYALGWSLGGQLACALAEREPARFAGLYLVASNPQFVAADNWPGMCADIFKNFQQSFNDRPEKTWQKFIALCSAGEPVELFASLLTQWSIPINVPQAAVSLSWLEKINSRSPVFPILLAQQDALVPTLLAEKMTLAQQVSGSHLLPYSQPDIVAQWFYACIEKQPERVAC